MSEKFVMGIDNGGTVIKAAIYDSEGKIHALAQSHMDTLVPQPLFTERDCEDLWQANIRAIRRCLEQVSIDPKDIAALAITGHGNGLYLAKKDGSASRNGIISTDARAQSNVDRWLEQPDYKERVQSKTGSTVWAGQPPALLAWLDDNEPEVFEETDYILSCKDYIRLRLTGTATLETTDACGVCLANILTREVDSDLFDFFGISRWVEKMPPVVDSTEFGGYVTEEVASATGLAAGTPVAGGTMDIVAGALASGLTKKDELSVITGTWSINQVISTDLQLENRVFLTDVYPIPDTWLILEGSPNGVSNLDWYIRNVVRRYLDVFGDREMTDGEVFALCEKLIHDFTPEVQDPFFLPFINGTSIIPDGRAGFVGMTSYHDMRHMVRAVYEGVIFSHMHHIKQLRGYIDLTGHVRFTGGAANSQIWAQMFADAIGLPLDIVDAEESGTLGSAMCSAVAAGIHPDIPTAVEHMAGKTRETVYPNPEFADLFQKRFARFEEHLASLGAPISETQWIAAKES
ncbi:MAG: FGGY-family carbohydrate kinase [Ancrocorticia sp.]|uniref:FGGY-family carbohydrate kinase n=1 Tax=Ancrocorticia sp. TaxID=2593684 RepID=UPI003F8FB347